MLPLKMTRSPGLLRAEKAGSSSPRTPKPACSAHRGLAVHTPCMACTARVRCCASACQRYRSEELEGRNPDVSGIGGVVTVWLPGKRRIALFRVSVR